MKAFSAEYLPNFYLLSQRFLHIQVCERWFLACESVADDILGARKDPNEISELNFPVILFVTLQEVVLTLDSVKYNL